METSTIVSMTPELAAELRDATMVAYRRPDLDRDGWNINSDKADRIATKMLRGEWADTTTIRVDRASCAAINGRAIIEAVIRSGVTIKCEITLKLDALP